MQRKATEGVVSDYQLALLSRSIFDIGPRTRLVMLVFVLLPVIALYFYKKEFSQFISYKLKYIFGFVGLGLFLIGIFFKVLHWPGWPTILVLSFAAINFGFLPFLFYRMYKKSVE